MHPVDYLFEEINRMTGDPDKAGEAGRKDRERPAWRLPRFRRESEHR